MKKIIPLFSLTLLCVFLLVSCGTKYYYGEQFTYAIEDGGLTIIDVVDSSIEDLVIPESENGRNVLSIDPNMFYNNDNIKSISLPSTLKSIGDSCFALCDSFETITLSPSMHMVTMRSFMSCKGLKEVIIPEGIKVIEMHAFTKCENILTIMLPSTITRIDSSAFYNNKSLEAVYYNGSADDFENIKIEKYNNDYFLDNIYYYSEDYIEGNYWQYVDGNPSKW